MQRQATCNSYAARPQRLRYRSTRHSGNSFLLTLRPLSIMSDILLQAGARITRILLPLCLLCYQQSSHAQQRMGQPMPGAPITLQNTQQRDTANKTNTSSWRTEKARVSFQTLHSKKTFYPDSSIQNIHRRPFMQGWQRDLGNLGSPMYQLLFTPEQRVGPTLGYHAFDAYRFLPDSLHYYNTNRPFSIFTYRLGSRAEQLAQILHTQNIRPNWNIAAQYRKINSPGNYKVQRTSHDFASITTNYQSINQHYKLNAAVMYNKAQHDENGGIVADSFLTLESFNDRRTIPVRFQNDAYSNRRSSVTNMHRDFTVLLQHSYTVGKKDTTYNEDSTQYAVTLLPRFRVAHRMQISTEKQQYKDLRPDSTRYAPIFQAGIPSNDSVFSEQKWFYVDNALMLHGFLGKAENQLGFAAGIGNRIDRFTTDFAASEVRENIISNYIAGELKKEALQPRQWSYEAQGRIFLTGNAAGNLLLRATVGKEISAKVGSIRAGVEQTINTAPYNYTSYRNKFYERSRSFNKETVTLVHGSVRNDFLKLEIGLKNYLIANYIYLNPQQEFSQDANTINLTQIVVRKTFQFGVWVSENDVAYQQMAGDAPINVPALMGRHRLAVETRVFGNALKIATGIDVRWHTAYEPAGYSAFFNRFYYQNSYRVSNIPEAGVYFNFKIKNFRAFLMGDQLQTFFARNAIVAPGFATQDAMIRFGFDWALVN